MSRKRTFRVVLTLLVGFFLGADLSRSWNVQVSTGLSFLAWIAFAALIAMWASQGKRPTAVLRPLAEILLLALLSTSVLYLYYTRSGVLDAGVHVDAAFTYVGFQWFTEFKNPITFAGGTPSYHQFAMMLLSHFPAFAIGFERLGPFAIHLGLMLHVALLLGFITHLLAPRPLVGRAVIVVLLSMLFSNRMLILSYDKVGYTIPAICLGLMFLTVADEESVPVPDRVVGSLLAIAILHFYTGLVFVAPVVALWLFTRADLPARLRRFVAQNPVLLIVMVLLTITVLTHPKLLFQRVKDITVASDDNALALLSAKIQAHWLYMRSAYPSAWFHSWFVANPGTWNLLSIAPLGGFLAPLVAGSWLVSAWTLGRHGLRYLAYLFVFAAVLITLSALQHLVTDFGDYRDFTLVFSLIISSWTFLFRVPRLGKRGRVVVLGYALLLGVYNYVDLGNLRGRLHGTNDYAYRSQQAMEAVKVFLGHAQSGKAALPGRIYVVVDSFFPLQGPYLEVLEPSGVPIHLVGSDSFCANSAAEIERLATEGCDSFLLVVHAGHCNGGDRSGDQGGKDTVRGELHESVCRHPLGAAAPRSVVPIELKR